MKIMLRLRQKCRPEVAQYGHDDVAQMDDKEKLGQMYKFYVLGGGLLNLNVFEEEYCVLMELVVWWRLTVLCFA